MGVVGPLAMGVVYNLNMGVVGSLSTGVVVGGEPHCRFSGRWVASLWV